MRRVHDSYRAALGVLAFFVLYLFYLICVTSEHCAVLAGMLKPVDAPSPALARRKMS